MMNMQERMALWANNPHLSRDDSVTQPVEMTEWGKFDLDEAAHRYRRYVQNRAQRAFQGKEIAPYPYNFSDTYIIKQPGTMEVCTPSGLSGLHRLIDMFLRHDMMYFTDTCARLLELKFESTRFNLYGTPTHIDDDNEEIVIGEDDSLYGSSFVASRGALITNFQSTVFSDARFENQIRAEEGRAMLYRGDSYHHRPDVKVQSGKYRVLARLLLRDPTVEYEQKDAMPKYMPAHIERRVTDRLVYTIF